MTYKKENSFIVKKTATNPSQPKGLWFFFFVVLIKTFSFDARGCDTLGCIATQHRVGFLVELAYYLK